MNVIGVDPDDFPFGPSCAATPNPISSTKCSRLSMSSLSPRSTPRKLAGAGVDVTDPEPLPAGHALSKFDNAIITPHISGRSDKDRARMAGVVIENIRRFAAGKPLINSVHPQKGY